MKFLTKTTSGTPQLVDGISSFTGVANQIPQTNALGYLDASILEVSATAGNILTRNTDGLFTQQMESMTAEITGASLTQNVNVVANVIVVFNTVQIPTLYGTNFFNYNATTGALTTAFAGRLLLSCVATYGSFNNLALQCFFAKNGNRVGSISNFKLTTGAGATRDSIVMSTISDCGVNDVFTCRMARMSGSTVTAASAFFDNPTIDFMRIA